MTVSTQAFPVAICYARRRTVTRGGRAREEVMAKGQMKGNKEAKKPKADKNQPKATVSAYKQSQSKGGQATTPLGKRS
jgi:hypothetical protein